MRFDLTNPTFLRFNLMNVTLGSFDANCWSGGCCWEPALCGRSLWEGDEQLLQQAAHHPHHL